MSRPTQADYNSGFLGGCLSVVTAGIVAVICVSVFGIDGPRGKGHQLPDTSHQSSLTLYGYLDQSSRAGTFLYVSPEGPVISGLIYFETCPEGSVRCTYIGYVKGGTRTVERLNWRTIDHNGEKIITDSEDIPRFKVTTSLNGGVGSLMFYLEPIDGGYFTTGCYQQTDQSEVSCPSNS